MGPTMCCVLGCGNDENTKPKKYIFTIPTREPRRSEWRRALGDEALYGQQKYCMGVCEDHFDLTKDLQNYMIYKLECSEPKLKPEAVPRVPIKKFDADRAYKKCLVPGCPTNTRDMPSKIFICVPVNESRREQWANVFGIRRPAMASKYGFCEDHFNLEEDCENLMMHRMVGTRLRLKEDAVPFATPHNRLRLDRDEAGCTSTDDSSSSVQISKREIEDLKCGESMDQFLSDKEAFEDNTTSSSNIDNSPPNETALNKTHVDVKTETSEIASSMDFIIKSEPPDEYVQLTTSEDLQLKENCELDAMILYNAQQNSANNNKDSEGSITSWIDSVVKEEGNMLDYEPNTSNNMKIDGNQNNSEKQITNLQSKSRVIISSRKCNEKYLRINHKKRKICNRNSIKDNQSSSHTNRRKNLRLTEESIYKSPLNEANDHCQLTDEEIRLRQNKELDVITLNKHQPCSANKMNSNDIENHLAANKKGDVRESRKYLWKQRIGSGNVAIVKNASKNHHSRSYVMRNYIRLNKNHVSRTDSIEGNNSQVTLDLDTRVQLFFDDFKAKSSQCDTSDLSNVINEMHFIDRCVETLTSFRQTLFSEYVEKNGSNNGKGIKNTSQSMDDSRTRL